MKVSMKMISELNPCNSFDELLSKLNKKADDEEMLEASSLVELAGVGDTLWFMGEMKMKSQLIEFAEAPAARYAAEYNKQIQHLKELLK